MNKEKINNQTVRGFKTLLTVLLLLFLSSALKAQGTIEDYKRANHLWEKMAGKVYHIPKEIKWNETGDLFWYQKNTEKGKVFVLVNPKLKIQTPLLDIKALAQALSKQIGHQAAIENIHSREIYLRGEDTVGFKFEGYEWEWNKRTKALNRKRKQSRPAAQRNYWGQHRDDRKGRPVRSPDGTKIAFIKNHNIFIAPQDQPEAAQQLTFDGSPGNYYSAHLQWSPDSKKILGKQATKVEVRQLTLISSSPKDQLQPKVETRDYPKPGDALSQVEPVVYNLDLDTLFYFKKQLISNQYAITALSWRQDSRAITFEYNQRGHQQYAVAELDATTGKSRYLINEISKTFIDYSGKRFRYDIADGKEILWMSERDGWNHLYRYDGKTGKVINKMTKGNWAVRKVVHVDEQKQRIILQGSGKNKDQDPYLIQYYSVDFNGKNLKALTAENGNHQAYFNKDYSYFVDVYSRVDKAPEAVLRDGSGKIVMHLETADDQELLATGWKPPEVFSAKGRDGETDIWGIIVRPTNFDPQKKYPVIENIYAGPQGSFVPKSYNPTATGMQKLAELGFIVVQIDGMGTSNRSKAFHDVCWKNLKDAGFPDRILWMKAAAKKYPSMDLDRVGIYGTSAGGQSSAGALLFHPEFYDVAVSASGCHDNRMDKIWWNEQWMGWPIGPQYAASSNVEHADQLQGQLMLMVGEMDDNVDPSSTYQFCHALIKANKNFELVVLPGMGHTSGGAYGEHKRRDFFVKHLLGVNPPAWN